jgi:tetratricopeptide (TPR) repeat protein
MSHSNLADYENGHRLAPAEVVQAYERELRLPPGSLVGLWEQARVELLGEMRTRRRRWVPPVRLTPQRAAVAQLTPRELPCPIADFTGRSEELAILRGLLAGSGNFASPPATAGQSVVIGVIDGMGGIGKSALAIQAAHELVAAGAFADGQLYLNLQGATPGLAPLEPLEALGRMLRALGVEPAQLPSEVEEAATRFRSLATGRKLLLVLDNAASAEQVRPLLPGSPTCGVLITGRHVLATLEGTRCLRLGVLPPNQALELLARIAGAERIAADPEAAVQLVRRCGYLPLAIRIAGARLVARPGWAVGVLARRLARVTSRLEELQVGELAVRASFDVSLEDLEQSPDPDDRAAAGSFGLLSLPDGPDLGLAAAARLLDQPEATTQRLLERLVDAQLLETPRPERYRFHDLVRLYAREQAESRHPESEQLDGLTRILSFYTATAWHTLAQLRPSDRRLATADPRWTEAGVQFSDASGALAWLEAERVNLLAGIRQAAAGAPAIPAELTCQLARALFGFSFVRGYWDDGIQANQTALGIACRSQDLAAQAHAHNDLGIFYWRLGRYKEAIASQQDSLTLFRELGDRRGEAASLGNLAHVYMSQGRYQDATVCLQDTLTLFRELGERCCAEAYSLNGLGVVYERLGRYAEAIASHQEALIIVREFGERWAEAYGLNSLGVVYERLGRYAEAIAFQQDSLIISRELGDRRGQAHGLNSLGVVYERLGRYAEAIAFQQDSVTLFRELGDRWGEAASLRDLGDALRAVEHDVEAEATWQEALAICEALQISEADEIQERLVGLRPQAAEPPGSK